MGKQKRHKLEQKAKQLIKDHRFYFYNSTCQEYKKVNKRLSKIRRIIQSLDTLTN